MSFLGKEQEGTSCLELHVESNACTVSVEGISYKKHLFEIVRKRK